jgi:hypothetical protein
MIQNETISSCDLKNQWGKYSITIAVAATTSTTINTTTTTTTAAAATTATTNTAAATVTTTTTTKTTTTTTRRMLLILVIFNLIYWNVWRQQIGTLQKKWQVHEIMTWTVTCLALPRRIERVGIRDSKTRGGNKYSCSKVMVSVSTDLYVADDWRWTDGVHCSKRRKNWSKFTNSIKKPSLVFNGVIKIFSYFLIIKK